MRWIVIGLMVGMLLATQACGAIGPTAAPNQPGVETVIAGTMQALTAAAPTAGNIPPGAIPVSFQNISFVIPNGLATGAGPELIPAIGVNQGAPWEVAPAYTKLTLVGYPLQGTFFPPQIVVYPAPELESVNPIVVESLEELRAVIGDPAVPLNDDIPGVPMYNAARVFGSQIQKLNTQNGSGVRMLTAYAQGISPINNHELIYQFQGFTNDGKYYIIANLPVNAAFLAADENPASPLPADGIPFPDLSTEDQAAIDAYFQAVTDRLNAMSPSSFLPALDQLDAFVQSITVSP